MQSVHLNPDWKEKFKRDYQELIVQKCSQETREAIGSNQDIQVTRLLRFFKINFKLYCFRVGNHAENCSYDVKLLLYLLMLYY